MFLPSSPLLDLLLRVLVLGPVGLLWVTVTVRVIGLRAFSKMASFDFVATVATGSLLASAATATKWPDFIQATLAITAVLGAQGLITHLRRRTSWVSRLLENEPIVLAGPGGEFDRKAMDDTRVTEADLLAKLRQANLRSPDDIRAIVLETTGDISILTSSGLDPKLLETVREPPTAGSPT